MLWSYISIKHSFYKEVIFMPLWLQIVLPIGALILGAVLAIVTDRFV